MNLREALLQLANDEELDLSGGKWGEDAWLECPVRDLVKELGKLGFNCKAIKNES